MRPINNGYTLPNFGKDRHYSKIFLNEPLLLLITLSSMKGNFLISLVTANTTYTTFDVVYTKVMLYTHKLCSTNQVKVVDTEIRAVYPRTDVYVVYLQLHQVYEQTLVVSPQMLLYVQAHMLCTHRHNMYQMYNRRLSCMSDYRNYIQGQSNNFMI